MTHLSFEEKLKLVEEYYDSKLSREAFCALHNLNIITFKTYISRYHQFLKDSTPITSQTDVDSVNQLKGEISLLKDEIIQLKRNLDDSKLQHSLLQQRYDGLQSNYEILKESSALSASHVFTKRRKTVSQLSKSYKRTLCNSLMKLLLTAPQLGGFSDYDKKGLTL